MLEPDDRSMGKNDTIKLMWGQRGGKPVTRSETVGVKVAAMREEKGQKKGKNKNVWTKRIGYNQSHLPSENPR